MSAIRSWKLDAVSVTSKETKPTVHYKRMHYEKSYKKDVQSEWQNMVRDDTLKLLYRMDGK